MSKNEDEKEKAQEFKVAELKKLAKLNYDELFKIIGRKRIDAPEGLEHFNFAREVVNNGEKGIEVSVFDHDLPPYGIKGEVPPEMADLLSDVEFGESRMQVWFEIGKDNFIDWWDDPSPDDFPFKEHRYNPNSPYLSLRIESSADDERRSLVVSQIRVPLLEDADDEKIYFSDEDFRHKLDNGNYLKATAMIDMSEIPHDLQIELEYKNMSVDQCGKSGLNVALSVYPDLVVFARLGDVE